MPSTDCLALAKDIVQEKPNWFKEGVGTNLELEELSVGLPSEMDYYKLGLPVLANSVASDGSRVIAGVAGDCKFVYRSLELVTCRLHLPYTTPFYACNRHGALRMGLVCRQKWRDSVHQVGTLGLFFRSGR